MSKVIGWIRRDANSPVQFNPLTKLFVLNYPVWVYQNNRGFDKIGVMRANSPFKKLSEQGPFLWRIEVDGQYIGTTKKTTTAYSSLRDVLSWGRGQNGGQALGPGGYCVCPSCGNAMAHKRGVPCMGTECPKCGALMVRENGTTAYSETRKIMESRLGGNLPYESSKFCAKTGKMIPASEWTDEIAAYCVSDEKKFMGMSAQQLTFGAVAVAAVAIIGHAMSKRRRPAGAGLNPRRKRRSR